MIPKISIAKDVLLGLLLNGVIATAGFWITKMLPGDTSKLIATAATIILAAIVLGFVILIHLHRKRLKLIKNYLALCHLLHAMVHRTRDHSIHSSSVVPPYSAPPQQPNERRLRPHPALEKNKAHISQMLSDVADTFELVVPSGVKVTASLRDLRADGGYHTLLRAGKYDPARALTTKPLYKETSMILKHLRQSYDQKSCVVLTGSNMGADWWERQVNDSYCGDLAVLMGVVMVRSWDGTDFIANKHAWIVSVSANREGVFTEADIPLMQMITDLFSAAANAMVREEGARGASGLQVLTPPPQQAA